MDWTETAWRSIRLPPLLFTATNISVPDDGSKRHLCHGDFWGKSRIDSGGLDVKRGHSPEGKQTNKQKKRRRGGRRKQQHKDYQKSIQARTWQLRAGPPRPLTKGPRLSICEDLRSLTAVCFCHSQITVHCWRSSSVHHVRRLQGVTCGCFGPMISRMLLGPHTSALPVRLKHDTLEVMVKARDWQFDQEHLLPAYVMAMFWYFFSSCWSMMRCFSFLLLFLFFFLSSIAHFLVGTFQNLEQKEEIKKIQKN